MYEDFTARQYLGTNNMPLATYPKGLVFVTTEHILFMFLGFCPSSKHEDSKAVGLQHWCQPQT